MDKPKNYLWFYISIFLIVMGINKQLDFQIAVTMIGRSVSEHLGLLEYSREIQKIVAVGIFGSMTILGLIILFKTRTILRESLLALSGVAVLAFFALVRVGSITHLHKGISFITQKISRIHSLELLGLSIILVSLIIGFHNLRKKETTHNNNFHSAKHSEDIQVNNNKI